MEEELLLKALADPKGLSGKTYNDGTPLTNMEYYLEVKNNPWK